MTSKDNRLSILFFGSTQNSVVILEKLYSFITTEKDNNTSVSICGVVTQPPRPIGRKQIITKTPPHVWAENHNIPVRYFETDPQKKTEYKHRDEIISQLTPFDYQLVISASYGQLIPWDIIAKAKYKGINIHPSLLPRWRGADPTPWTILSGDTYAGVSIVGMTSEFDQGHIYAQKQIPLQENMYHEDLRQLLFEHGANLLKQTLPSIIDGTNTGIPQDSSQAVYARRLTREDGYIPWSILKKAINGEKIDKEELPPLLKHIAKDTSKETIHLIQKAIYALSPWPGVWTNIKLNTINKDKMVRMKILMLSIQSSNNPSIHLDLIQLEGKTPQPFQQIEQLVV